MGSTCFMSVILQSLMHNPYLQHYFLSEGHRTADCTHSFCISCEVADIFHSMFSENSSSNALGLTNFLTSVWKSQKEIAGYAQQDAHEFFVGLINQIHLTSDDPKYGLDCKCIIHESFCGQLLSKVTCGSCGNVTNSFDPVLDLSLELRSKQGNTILNSLQACFERFTSEETLMSYLCGKCEKKSVAVKQLTLRVLPRVLSLQLKVRKRSLKCLSINTSALNISQHLPRLMRGLNFQCSWTCRRSQAAKSGMHQLQESN
jgi:ubiquitin carboxyl-terminal hydrolase 22/27/51